MCCRPARTRFGNGLEARYTYFTPQELPWAGLMHYGRLRRICVLPQSSEVNCESDATPPAEALLNIALHYDKAGNVTIWRDAGKQERLRFEYDSLNRLIAATPLPVGGWQPALAAYSETYAYDAIGNFVSKGGVTQWYSDTAHVHAVTHFNGDRRAWYDQNGNMTQRVEMSGSQRITYTQEWDVENKLVAVTNTVSGQVTRFYRDADGALVKKSDGAGTVMIVGSIFEHITATNESTSYYLFGGQRVAMRTSGAVYWLHGDHLGSASMTTNASGQKVAELRYLPFGETRWAWGTTPTDRRYTGQRELAGVGLYDYNARMYWPAGGRFVSADSIVPRPGNPQAFNRYMYVLGNPLRHIDPSGHDPLDENWRGEFYRAHGRLPTQDDIRARLFSLLFCGSSGNCAWTNEDWEYYNANSDGLWSAKATWRNRWGEADPRVGATAGLSAFSQHVAKLATHYVAGEEAQFVKAFFLIWGDAGGSGSNPSFTAVRGATRSPAGRRTPLWEGRPGAVMQGWSPAYIDAVAPEYDQGHHYAFFLYVGYFLSEPVARAGVHIADPPEQNRADYDLGNLAVDHAIALKSGWIGLGDFASVMCAALSGGGACP